MRVRGLVRRGGKVDAEKKHEEAEKEEGRRGLAPVEICLHQTY
jgi:hypothetical protein